jgi:hypothetical protein
MISKKSMNGNSLVSLLSFILFCGVFLFLVAQLIYPSLEVDNAKNGALQQMITDTKGSAFELAFKDQIVYFTEDGGLTNKEFSQLKKTYTNYKTASITGNQDKFVSSMKEQLKTDRDNAKSSAEFWSKANLFLVAFVLLGAVIGGYKIAWANR